jgi:hypothetical protein
MINKVEIEVQITCESSPIHEVFLCGDLALAITPRIADTVIFEFKDSKFLSLDRFMSRRKIKELIFRPLPVNNFPPVLAVMEKIVVKTEDEMYLLVDYFKDELDFKQVFNR